MMRASIALALLLLAAEVVGLFVFKRVEVATILCGVALVTFACWRARWADAAGLFVLLFRGAAIVFGAAIATAGGFDLLDLGRGTVRGDWDTGFFVAVALLLPSALVYVWVMYRPVVTAVADTNKRSGSFPDRSDERATTALFVATVAGVFASIAIDDRSPLVVALVASVCGVATGLVSIVHQALRRQRSTRLQFFVELAAGFVVACGLMVGTELGGLLPVFVWLVALGFSSAGVPATLPVSRRVTAGILNAGQYVFGWAVGALIGGTLAVGALGSRQDMTLGEIVASQERIIPLSSAAYARLLMTDEYLWADKVSGTTFWAGPDWRMDADMQISAWRIKSIDRWSIAIPKAYFLAREGGLSPSAGFELAPDAPESVVAYVHRGSPAEQAGVKRGWRLLQTSSVRHGESAALFDTVFEDGSGQRHLFKLPYELRRSPMTAARILTVDDRHVGYLFLSAFNGPAEAELQDQFADFQRHGIQELILDLRYNSGGALKTALLLADLIAGDRAPGAVFERVVRSAKYADGNETRRLSRREHSLSLKRVVVLTTRSTCSASEAVINGLAPHIEVVTVGERTCGKPVGFVVKTFRGTAFAIVSFKVENSRGEGDYVNGLEPTCHVAEDFGAPLGSQGDPLVDGALAYLRDGKCAHQANATPAAS